MGDTSTVLDLALALEDKAMEYRQRHGVACDDTADEAAHDFHILAEEARRLALCSTP
ncbi:MAG: hypothetical protein ABW143_02550 [Acidimicrobiales bacterium]